MKTILFVVLSLLLACFATALSSICTPTSDSCNFYLGCLEKAKPCGSAGYAIGYGDKYCNKFSQKHFHSESAKKWLVAAKKCLQENLVPIVNNPSGFTCEGIIDLAFDSHPLCYTQPIASICSIRDPRDLTSILFTVDGKDLFTLRSGKQIKDVIAVCAHQFWSLSDNVEEMERHRVLQPGEVSFSKIRSFWLHAAKIAKVEV